MVERLVLAEGFIPGRPMSWKRVSPRAGGVPFVPKECKAESERIAWELKSFMGRTPRTAEPVSVSLSFFLPTRGRIDVDNLCKLVFDAANEVVFDDDSQVWDLRARKVFGSGRTGTYVKIALL